MSAISIEKGPIQLAGLLFRPSVNASGKGLGVVVVHPGGVKEQTAQLYAQKLAGEGFVAVCYDASHQGESGGEPHFLEDPAARVGDVWAAVDYLQRQDNVDPEKVAVLGICAGGGYAVAAAKADQRLKAVATISMVNIGDSARLGWYGDEDPSQQLDSLKQAAQQITAEITTGAERAAAPYVPPQPDEKTPYDLKQAHDYYLTPRCQHPRAANTMLYDSFPRVLTFDAFHLADIFLKQPTLLIVGEDAGSRWHTEKLDKLVGGVTKKIVVSKGTHMDFYDKLPFVDPAAQNVAAFFKEHLS